MSSEHVDYDPFAGPAILATAPSTEPQREIWTATLLGDDASLAYNESVGLRIRGELDIAALRASIADLVERHESLRTIFGADGTTLCVLAHMDATLEVQDLSGLDETTRQQRIDEYCTRVVEEPFNLEKGPLFRTALLKLGVDEAIVFFTAHHIVFDGYSTGVLVTDWGHLYSAHKSGTTAQLKPAETFSEYARKERAIAESPERLAHERYWLEQYPGEVPVLELPYDRARPTLKTYASRRIDITLESELVRDIKKTGAKQGASLFATLLSGFGMLMSRLSGQTDVVIGIPAAGQSVGEHDTLVGHCVNMLPFRGNFEPTQALKNLLGVTRRQVLDAYDHQEYTFGSLLKKLTIPRDPSRLPLVSVVFNMDRGLTADALPFDGLAVNVRTNPRHFENFDLFVNAVDMRDHVILEVQYNTDLFDASTIYNWFDSYSCLLRSMTQNVESAISDLKLVSDAEQAKIDGWNNTRVERLTAQCVHELIEAQADRTPDAIAIEFEGTQISYREFDRRANQLARRLQQLGVGRDVLVGLCLERSIEMLIGMFAVHKAGGGYVPLDPGYPHDRLSYMVQDSAMPVLLTDSKLREELNLSAKHVVCIDTEAESLAALSAERLTRNEATASANSLAYVIYTSGSTGKPKGVLIEHHSVVNLIGSLHVTPGLTSSDVVLAITTLSFDIAVSELILPLTAGAKILLTSRDVAADGARLMQSIAEGKVTFIDATPATYRLLLAAGWTGDKKLRVICTGEAMPRDLALDLVPRVGQVWNGYGPTETTVWSTFYEVRPPVGRILIGRPVDNTQIYILDSRGHQVPVGTTGEMFIGGNGLARGYLNRPELTTERFVPDPFSGTAGARMYKTGDLARYLPDGNIECLGRNDTQVKLRGFRIELGEIENALATHPNIASAAVIVREDRPGDKRLCAYFVTRGEVSETHLRPHLKLTLPDYMVPQHYTVLDRMPLTPSGKIDRKALPAPSGEARVSDVEFVAPRTETEQMLAALWKEALVLSRVSVFDDFFALGGHSLLASQILGRLRREHGINMPFRKLFEAPTIARLAILIDGEAISERKREAPIAQRRDAAIVPLSFAQKRQWLVEELDPAQRLVHSVRGTWQLDGDLNVQFLQKALDEIGRRHEILRMSVQTIAGEETMQFAPSADLTIGYLDFRHLPEAERDAAVRGRIEQLHSEPFDLRHPPLFRSTLFRVADQCHVYFTLRHTMVWDGWSYDVFLKELCALYAAFEAGSEPRLPHLTIGYGDYAIWYKEWLRSDELGEQVRWWKNHLGQKPPTIRLPYDFTRPARMTHAGANERCLISKQDSELLHSVARASGATLYTVLLAAYVVLLNRYTGQSEVLIGTPVRGRTRPELENLIGSLVNTLALRLRVNPEQSFDDLVTQTRDLTIDAFSHQEMPLECLESSQPTLRALFSLQDARERPRQAGSLKVTQLYRPLPIAGDDMTLWVMDYGDELLSVLNYSTELFETSTMRTFLQRYIGVLTQVGKNSRLPIEHIQLLDERENSLLTSYGNRNASLTGVPDPLEYLERQALATPDAISHQLLDVSTTFGELSSTVTALAHRLAASGVVPTSTVAICLPHTAELVATIYAALKCGARVVLLDPKHPLHSILEILRDSRAKFVVTIEGIDLQWPDGPTSINLSSEVVASSTEGQGQFSVDCPAEAPALRYYPALNSAEAIDISRAVLSQALAAVRALPELSDVHTTVVASSSVTSEYAILELLLGPTLGAKTILAHDERLDAFSDWNALALGPGTAIVANAEEWSQLCRVLPLGMSGTRAFSIEVPGARTPEPDADTFDSWFTIHTRLEWAFATFVRSRRTNDTRRYVGRILGMPIGSTRVAVVNETGRQCPVGIYGDLHADGSDLVLGIDSSQTALPTKRKMKARWRDAGLLELKERDEVNLVLGIRVNARRIQSILEGHASVRRAAITVRADSYGEQIVVAYLELDTEYQYTTTDLRDLLREDVPPEIMPRMFIEVAVLPLLANGEVDVSNLPPPEGTSSRDQMIAPRTQTEKVLAALWCEALGVDHVSICDNFFNLGGHSLLCFNVLAMVEERLNQKVSPRLMLLDTLEQIAAVIDQQSQIISGTPLSVPPASGRSSRPPLSTRLIQQVGKILGR